MNSIGTITLGDFKESIKLKNPNSYRIYFKSQDPEFGFLKEEVSHKVVSFKLTEKPIDLY